MKWITPPQDDILQLLDYEAETGALTWRPRPESYFSDLRQFKTWNNRFSGKRAGYIRPDGYLYVRIGERQYLAQRLIWKMVHGQLSDVLIDHRDGHRSNNALINLKITTYCGNGRNMSRSRANTSGFTGVSYHRKTGKWQVSARGDGVQEYLGIYASVEAAAVVARDHRLKAGYSPRHGQIGDR